MKRTQLYLDDHLWDALHNRAIAEQTTLSELVRQAVREKYFGNLDERRKAMQDFVGTQKDSSQSIPAGDYIRNLRRGSRLDQLRRPHHL